MAEAQKKPPFDPSKPYRAVEEKPAFDPSQPYNIVQPEFTDVQEQPGPLKQFAIDAINSPIGQGVIKAGQFIDSYTGAPTRAAVYAAQRGENPIEAFGSQFGGDSEKAPTGKMIAEKAGASSDETLNIGDFKFSPSGAIGLGLDVALDPTNLFPAYAAVKSGARAGMTAARSTAEGAKTLAKGALELATEKSPTFAKGVEAAGKLGDVASDVSQKIKGALTDVFKPVQSSDWQMFKGIAEKNGIDPTMLTEAHEFGPGSFVTRASKNLREGPLGQPDMDKFFEGLQQVQTATDNKIKQIAGGKVIDEVAAGNVIRQGYDNAVERLFQNVDFTYNQVINQSPGISLTSESNEMLAKKLNSLEKWADSELQLAVTKTEKTQAAQVKSAINGVRRILSQTDKRSGSFGTLAQTYDAMSRIGRYAFKTGQNSLSDVPVNIEKMRDLYFALRGEFINSTAAQLGDDVANTLIDSNEQITQFMKNKSLVSNILGNEKLGSERVFQSLVLNGDTKKLQALKEILSPSEMNEVKGAILENLIKRNPDGTFNFNTLHSAMRNKKTLLMEVFSPDELVDVGELVKLGAAFGDARLSTSGTGASNLFADLTEGIKRGATTRSVVELMKDSARGRGVVADAQRLLPTVTEGTAITPVTRGRFLPSRTKPEETAKLLQILSTTNNAAEREKENATQRRLRQRIEERYRGQ